MAIPTSKLKKLFDLTMKKDWKEVAKIYEDDEWARKAQLTKRGDTALHVALLVSYKSGDISASYAGNVKKMINCMLKDSLTVKNIKGNTPLHLAAAVGWKGEYQQS